MPHFSEAWCSGVDFLYSIDYEGMVDRGDIHAQADVATLQMALDGLPATENPGELIVKPTGVHTPVISEHSKLLPVVDRHHALLLRQLRRRSRPLQFPLRVILLFAGQIDGQRDAPLVHVGVFAHCRKDVVQRVRCCVGALWTEWHVDAGRRLEHYEKCANE